jgi:hypothetical protein
MFEPSWLFAVALWPSSIASFIAERARYRSYGIELRGLIVHEFSVQARCWKCIFLLKGLLAFLF